MILWKTWFDLRFRFFFSLAFLILIVMMMIVFFPLSRPLISELKPDIAPQEMQRIQRLTSDYRLFMDEGWFQEIQFIGIFAVIFALGGVMTEPKARTISLTLSLPVKRRHWLLYHAGLAVLLVIALSTAASLLIIAGGVVYGETYPLLRAAGGTLLMAFLTIPWIGLTMALTSFTRDKLRTILIIFFIWFVLGLVFLL